MYVTLHNIGNKLKKKNDSYRNICNKLIQDFKNNSSRSQAISTDIARFYSVHITQLLLLAIDILLLYRYSLYSVINNRKYSKVSKRLSSF